MKLNLSTIKQASITLNDAINLHQEELDNPRFTLALRDSVIQRFEYTYELAWKIIKRWLSENVSPESAEPIYSRKELFRLAANWGLIQDPLQWFEYHKARNISAHTYNELEAEQVLKAACGLARDVETLIEELEKRND